MGAGDATKNRKEGADYYISKNKVKTLGWRQGKSPSTFVPDKMITGGIYDNANGHLPDAPGRVWQEADINYYEGKRNGHRVLWSNDGLVFVTYDHYATFYEII